MERMQESLYTPHTLVHDWWVSTLEDLVSCAVNVGKHSGTSSFVVHQRAHAGEWIHVVNLEKSFRQSSTLCQHQSIQTGVMQYNCSKCGKFLSHKSVLISPYTWHSGENSYVCGECSKSFTSSSASLTIRDLTQEKGLMSVVTVRKLCL